MSRHVTPGGTESHLSANSAPTTALRMVAVLRDGSRLELEVEVVDFSIGRLDGPVTVPALYHCTPDGRRNRGRLAPLLAAARKEG